MKRALLILAITIPAGARALPAADSTPSKPNILIVLTDDQGSGDFSSHGNPVLKTPALDRLRDQSVRFTDFHSAPMCTPTRGQLMTGMDAVRNVLERWSAPRRCPYQGFASFAVISMTSRVEFCAATE